MSNLWVLQSQELQNEQQAHHDGLSRLGAVKFIPQLCWTSASWMLRPRDHWYAWIDVLYGMGSNCFVRAQNRWHCRTEKRFRDIVVDIVALHHDVDVVSLTLLVNGYFIYDGVLCVWEVVCWINLSHGVNPQRKRKQRMYIFNDHGLNNYDILHDLLLLHQQELLLLGIVRFISQLHFGFSCNFISPWIAKILVREETLSKSKKQLNISCTVQQCETRIIHVHQFRSVHLRASGGLRRRLWWW